jgi:hypothetical protein
MTKVEVPTYFTNHHAVSMTLRDYFAAAALPMAIQEMNEAESYDLNDSASLAYSYADAMMKAREEK